MVALTSPFKSKIRLEAENAVLRHQLIVLRRQSCRTVAAPEFLHHAGRRDPGGRWGLTAQRGQAELRCQTMNANLWPKELSEREESPTHQQQQHGAHSAGGEVTVGEPQQSQSGRYPYIDARA
jgi:hypothetical protein